MTRQVWLGVAMLATGVSLLVAAGLAAGATGAAKSAQAAKVSHGKTGLSMNIAISNTDFDYLDPALAYSDWSWQFTYLMNCKLMNYPDKNAPEGTKLQPEASEAPIVSKDGLTYTFTIKKDAGGCKFNTGEAVTAPSFAHAIRRTPAPWMQSAAAQFITDVKGAQDVLDGKAQTASGVVVKGNQLIITLTKPGADFLARISLPFFAAIPANMPLNSKGE